MIGVGLATPPLAGAQTAAAPSFDVASLKPAQPSPPYPVDLGNTLHGRVTLTNVTLTECLRFAFKINNDSQIAGPDWIKSRDVLFDIVGKAPPETPKDRLRLMILNLLQERFKLTLHHEQRELAYLALVAGKKGSKLRPAAAGAGDAGNEVRQGRIAVRRVSINTLIVLLGRFTSRPIMDMTGLEGLYDVNLEWTPLNQRAPKQGEGVEAAAAAVPEGPTLFDAIQEQLGLKLEMRKGPMDVIVVDHAEKTPLSN
ncbi:MAG TPA: TIGR03435 family protein [Bryobacteraceae bacterium]|nr:TIGR03435 family protein [Bryobacteraceae bacterium]